MHDPDRRHDPCGNETAPAIADFVADDHNEQLDKCVTTIRCITVLRLFHDIQICKVGLSPDFQAEKPSIVAAALCS
jgi:hypothetical protein